MAPCSWITGLGTSMKNSLDGYFCITERGSTFGKEFRAGTTAFLTLSYLLLVNPQIMSLAGVSHSNGVMATCLSSAVSSLLIGIFGNLPFGLAPGIGLSAYLAYGLVLAGLATLSEALTACFASGFILFLCAISGLAHVIMRIVPRSIKLAIVVGMGLLIALIGMVSISLIISDEKTLVTLGPMDNWNIFISMFGVILVASLLYHNVQGAILIGIAVLTLIFWTMEKSFPTSFVEVPHWDGTQQIDLSVLWQWDRAPVIYTAVASFLFICIFDVSGVMFGLATLAGLMEEDGSIPRSIWGFFGSAAGTMVASFFGSTPIIVTVECASGVKEGGRTGLTAVVIAFYFLLSLFLAPLFGAVPEGATAPVLILIGTLMMGEAAKIDWETMDSAVPAFLVIMLIPLTYSITNGIVFGLAAALCFYFTTGNAFGDIGKAIKMARGENDGEQVGLLLSEDDRQQAMRYSIHDHEVLVFSERNPNYGAV